MTTPVGLSAFTTLASTSVGTSGFVLWFPQFCCEGSNGATQSANNLIGYVALSSGNSPSIAGALFAANSNATYVGIRDPAYAFVNTAIVEDARTLAACVKMVYTGTTSSSQGLVYPLTNVPLDVVFNGGGTGVYPSVNQMLRYAGNSTRADQPVEVKWTPDQSAMQFQDFSYGPLLSATGAATTNASADGTYARTSQPMGFGFVFQNVSEIANYIVSFTKVFEWRPKPVGGLQLMASENNIADPSFVRRAVAYLDSTMPDWRTRAYHAATGSLGSMLRSLVLGGSDVRYDRPRDRIEL